MLMTLKFKGIINLRVQNLIGKGIMNLRVQNNCESSNMFFWDVFAVASSIHLSTVTNYSKRMQKNNMNISSSCISVSQIVRRITTYTR